MFTAFASDQRVRLSSSTNTQGMPLERLPYLLRRTQARMSLAQNLTWGELHDEDTVGWTF